MGAPLQRSLFVAAAPRKIACFVGRILAGARPAEYHFSLVDPMPLTPSPVTRTRLHTRRITFEGFQRGDGLFDIEGHLTDTKDHDYALLAGDKPPGVALHDMRARVASGRDYCVR